jgi:hypothetical protein
MQTPLEIGLLVLGILLGNALIQGLVWYFILRWMRGRRTEAIRELAAAIESEAVIRPPEAGRYRGATAPGYPFVKNSGVIALTDKRLVFRTLTRAMIEIPLPAITGVRESKGFNSAMVAGRTHLVVGTHAGEIAFFVADNSAWIAAVNRSVTHRTHA